MKIILFSLLSFSLSLLHSPPGFIFDFFLKINPGRSGERVKGKIIYLLFLSHILSPPFLFPVSADLSFENPK